MTISATNRTRVVVLLTSVGLALVILLTFTVSARADDAGAGVPAVTYADHVVQSGDTLWDIALDHTPAGGDVRNVVVDIKSANHLSSSVIVPGQVLLVPTP